MSYRPTTVTVHCPHCTEQIFAQMGVEHDPGCRYTKNGDGWPESWDYEVYTTACPECGGNVEDEAFAEACWTAFWEQKDDR